MRLTLRSRIWRARWPIYCEVAFVALLDLVHEVIRALVAPGGQGVRASLVHAHDIAHLEAALEANVETSVQRITDAIAGGRFATTWYYTLAYTTLFVGFLFGVWVWRRQNYAFVRNWFVMSQAIALVVVWRYPSAPPRLAASGLIDTTRHALTLGGALGWFQQLRNQYAAMPSLHIRAVVSLCAGAGMALCVLGPLAPGLVGAAAVDGLGDDGHGQSLSARWHRRRADGACGPGDHAQAHRTRRAPPVAAMPA